MLIISQIINLKVVGVFLMSYQCGGETSVVRLITKVTSYS